MALPKPLTNDDWGYSQPASAAKMIPRFWAHVTKDPGCWLWTGFLSPYGRFRVGADRMMAAHRVAWVLAHGAIPGGTLVLHHCDVQACVKTEPDEQYPEGHLFLGTNADNTHDMYAKGRAAPRPLYGSAKLTRKQRDEIRRRRAVGENGAAIARDIGCSESSVYQTASGRIWKIDTQEDHT